MSQSNSFPSRNTPSKHSQSLSKIHIIQWIRSVLPSFRPSFTIESLGDGEAYCRIINHYVPGTILPSRIISAPSNEYECSLNLKQLQIALNKLRINVHFDIHKVAKLGFNENWNLAVAVFKQLGEMEEKKICSETTPKALKETNQPKRKLHQPAIINQSYILSQNPTKHNETMRREEMAPKYNILYHIDRVKEILISNSNDSYKVKLIRMLFGVDDLVKIEQSSEPKVPPPSSSFTPKQNCKQ